ncbi:TRAFs-binding domain-containing protein [Novispirillum itersonii]|uniref:TRAFs-binding domain-containing protein n=1 Tax=Novispirillum itersonii TaxID=189 RepID=UPI00039A3A9D|nr:TRAFs-binding domain-containing protein [Novispirillum itersonii]
MKDKLCFTIMGFGKKTDFSTGKTYDLDKTYANIIKPAVENCGYTSVRADEIQDSGIIDKSMYALLVRADLVIADITTLNPNAIYELGIRHAARPNHTVILKDKEGKIPFDLDHNRFLIYTHLGDDVGASEAQECQNRLQQMIKSIEAQGGTDSPLFEYLNGITPHKLSDEDYKQVISRLLQKENHVFAFSEKAKELKANGDFIGSSLLWEKASSIMPDEHYFIQQHALCLYKSEHPSKETSLLSALTIISKIYSEDDTNDPETLGLVGAIYKRLFETNGDKETLNLSINAYKRGYILSRNYYTGENYATCLDMLAETTIDEEEAASSRFEAKRTRKEIIESLSKQIQDTYSQDPKWAYATLANCNLHLRNYDEANKYESLFFKENPDQWEVETYHAHKPKFSDKLDG